MTITESIEIKANYCIGSTWFPPREIRFSREQLTEFILPNLNELRRGEYPPECRETGYEDIKSKNIPRYAYFIAAAEIAAEIDARLMMCGDKADIILGLYVPLEDGTMVEPGQIAKDFGVSDDELYWLQKRLLNYLSGWRRRTLDFEDWWELKLKQKKESKRRMK